MSWEDNKQLGIFSSVTVERVVVVEDMTGERRYFMGYRFVGRTQEGQPVNVMIAPRDVASVLAVIQADVEEERRELLLRTEIEAVKKRHKTC
jgi:hypothetical protein